MVVKEWYSVKEVAHLISVNPQTVRAMIKDGRLNSRRFGVRIIRINYNDLIKLKGVDNGSMVKN